MISANRLKKKVHFLLKTDLPMFTLFDAELFEIDRKIAAAQPFEIPHLFRGVPLDVFGELLLDVPAKFPNIKAFLPTMATEDVQDLWTGRHGFSLLAQSLAFIKTLTSVYAQMTNASLEDALILDYGCGWGRLIRLLYKFVSFENIYGVDPWDQSIIQCQSHRIKAHLALCEYMPTALPFERQFDLIYAFSVFAHLSEEAAETALSTLRKYVAPTGVLAITILPKEFWYTPQASQWANMPKMHDEQGFAFTPIEIPAMKNNNNYGWASISPDYFAKNFPEWKLEKVEYNIIDPYQMVLFFRPR